MRRKKNSKKPTIIYRDNKKNIKVMSQGSTSKPVIVSPIDDSKEFELETSNPKLKPYLKKGKLSFIVKSDQKQDYKVT